MLLKAIIINLPATMAARKEAADVLAYAGFQNIVHDRSGFSTATVESDFTQMADDTLMGVMRTIQRRLPTANVLYRFASA